ncbi:MAG TPA: hypothetical protein DG753_07365 [Clostridium sp.]|nr:hypothetical protein [Clostridium sp.]
MSKKYIESMNKITMDDKLKKRILEKVSQVSEEEINNNIIDIQKNKRHSRGQRRFAGVAAACCALFVCAGLKVKFPELFNINNKNIDSSNEVVVDNNSEFNDNNNILENTDKYNTSNNENNDINNNSYVNNSVSVDYKLETKSEEVPSNNIARESKQESNVIKSNKNNQTSSTVKSVESTVNNEVNGIGNQNNNQIESHNTQNKIVNDSIEENNAYKEDISNNNEPSVISENNQGKEYLQNDITKNVDLEINDGKDSLSSTRATNIAPENVENNFIIPKALKNNYEITDTDSSDLIKVVYKNKEYGDGELIISSKEIVDNDKNFSSVEDVKTSEGSAVIKISEDGKEKYADWKYENKYYSLHTKENVDDEKIIYIIESCR